MSAPRSKSSISSLLSNAASRPISGFAPAPKPSVIVLPICNLISAEELFKTCKSVLTAANSTPLRPESIIRFTALQPPPPIPNTLMLAI